MSEAQVAVAPLSLRGAHPEQQKDRVQDQHWVVPPHKCWLETASCARSKLGPYFIFYYKHPGSTRGSSKDGPHTSTICYAFKLFRYSLGPIISFLGFFCGGTPQKELGGI